MSSPCTLHITSVVISSLSSSIYSLATTTTISSLQNPNLTKTLYFSLMLSKDITTCMKLC